MKRATIGHAGRHARRDCRGGRASLAAIVANGFAPGCPGVIRRCEGAIQEVTAGPDGAADELAADANDAATARIEPRLQNARKPGTSPSARRHQQRDRQRMQHVAQRERALGRHMDG